MRESGYYRVILNKDYGWEIAVYNAETKAWHVCGIDNGHSDSDFEAIDENRINPEPECEHDLVIRFSKDSSLSDFDTRPVCKKCGFIYDL